MYICKTKSHRCALCYALLSTNASTNGFSAGAHRKYARRCSSSSIERLSACSDRFERLWRQNGNATSRSRAICYRCSDAIRQLEQIQTDIEQLDHQKQLLLNKIEHSLSKRALVVHGQRHRGPLPNHNHQEAPLYEDEDTEEGEEKPRTVVKANGHGHASPILAPTPTLVGAKRRKCNIAQKINLEDKVAELSSALAGHPRRSSSPATKFSTSLLFGSHSPKPPRSSLFSSSLNGHDLTSLAFGSSYKPLTNTSLPSTTPPFLDPTTGALIAIVSNPHHAALLAQQHQQMLKPSSISPSSTNTIDEHEPPPPPPLTLPVKPSPHPKKFPCMLCGRDFSNKSNLNRHHSIVHVAIRNFECARCPKKFKLRQGLKTHMQRCHGVNTDEPTFVLQKHHLHNYHHHHHHPSSSSSFLAQANK